jgi:hypothetical protein
MGETQMSRLSRFSTWLSGAVLVFALGASSAQAQVTFTATNGTLAAYAVFSLSGTDLTVSLTNAGPAAAHNNEVLTALFFNASGSPTLTTGNANLGSGAQIIDYNGNPVGGINAADGWAFAQGSTVSSQLAGSNYGIGAAGFGIFGQSNFANSVATNVDGTPYGIVNGVASPNQISGGAAPQILVSNATASLGPPISGPTGMVFTLHGFTGSLGGISGVQFQYGTSLSDTRIPEPSTIACACTVGLFGLGLVWRRRKARAA